MMKKSGGVSGGAAPTGCYKCGRPGHWSRDCPSNPNSSNNPTSLPVPPNNTRSSKPKVQRRSRPKLTPDLLLSDGTGIGYILRYFPPAFKCRGRGREVNDLKHLLCMYAEWHLRLLPYYNLGQFIHKVEQVGSTKRVKVCLRELRERVADGVNLQEPQVEQKSIDEGGGGLDMPSSQFQENDFPNENTNNVANEEDITGRMRVNVESINGNGNGISEEQRGRMEANRLKALERAIARNRKRSLS